MTEAHTVICCLISWLLANHTPQRGCMSTVKQYQQPYCHVGVQWYMGLWCPPTVQYACMQNSGHFTVISQTFLLRCRLHAHKLKK